MIYCGEEMEPEIKSKFVALLSFLMILINFIIIIKIGDVTGYEVSIYNAYPTFFWIFIILSIWFGIISIAFTYYHSRSWIYGLLVVFISYSIVFFLPTIRGYLFFASTGYDLFAHLSWIQYILDSGYLKADLIYPTIHILSAILCLFGLDLDVKLINFINWLFWSLYILYFIILGKELTKSSRSSVIFLFFASPIMFSFLNQAFLPYGFALFIIPLFMYLLHKRFGQRNRIEFAILTILFSFLIIFFHPLICFAIFLTLVAYYTYSRFAYNKNDLMESKSNAKTLILILLTSFLVWYMNFNSFFNSVKKLYVGLFSPENLLIDQQTEIVSATNATFIDLIIILMKMVGPFILYITLGGFFSFIILKKIRNQKQNRIYSIYLLFFTVSGLFAFFQVFQFSVIYEPVRVLAIPVVFVTILCALVFNDFLENKTSGTINKTIVLVVICTVCFSSILGLASIYDSPWKGIAGSHMTIMESSGWNWYLAYNNNSYPLLSNMKSIYKYELYYSQENSNFLTKSRLLGEQIPSHFGYKENNNFIDNFGYNKMYFITDEKMKYLYFAAFESEKGRYPKYTDHDFELLNQDRTVEKYYSNGEFIIWKVSK